MKLFSNIKLVVFTRRNLREFLRVTILLALTVTFLLTDANRPIFISMIGAVVGISLLSHILRRVLFPYVDLEKFFTKSLESSISSSICVLSVCIILSVLLLCSVLFLRA